MKTTLHHEKSKDGTSFPRQTFQGGCFILRRKSNAEGGKDGSLPDEKDIEAAAGEE